MSFLPDSAGKPSVTQVEHIQWLDVQELPSRFIPYPEGTKIQYRRFMFGEIMVLNDRNTSLEEVEKIMKEGIRGIDPEALSFFDLMAIGVFRTLATVGGLSWVVELTCPCGHSWVHKFDQNALEFTELEIPKLPIIVTMDDGTEFHFDVLRAGDRNKLPDKEGINFDIATMATCVRNLKFEEAYKRIYNASREEGDTIKKVDELTDHGLKNLIVTCEKCKKSQAVNLTVLNLDKLRPFCPSQRPDQSRIRFGETSEPVDSEREANGVRRDTDASWGAGAPNGREQQGSKE